MRNNAPVEHCVAEAFILHREIVLTMQASITLRAYLMSEDTRKSAMKNKHSKQRISAVFHPEDTQNKIPAVSLSTIS